MSAHAERSQNPAASCGLVSVIFKKKKRSAVFTDCHVMIWTNQGISFCKCVVTLSFFTWGECVPLGQKCGVRFNTCFVSRRAEGPCLFCCCFFIWNTAPCIFSCRDVWLYFIHKVFVNTVYAVGCWALCCLRRSCNEAARKCVLFVWPFKVLWWRESLCVCVSLNKQHEVRSLVNHHKTEALQPSGCED